MNTQDQGKLDAALAKLPRRLEPERDLWPEIAARIGLRHPRRWRHFGWDAAAAAAVIAAAVIIAWTVAPSPANPPVAVAQAPSATPGAPADPRVQFMAQLAGDSNLPSKARGALLNNLRLVHEDILRSRAAVKKYPADVNLQALLFNLYQQEAHLLNEAQRAQIQTSTRTVI